MAVEYYVKQRKGHRKIVATYTTSERAQKECALLGAGDYCVVYSPDALELHLARYGK